MEFINNKDGLINKIKDDIERQPNRNCFSFTDQVNEDVCVLEFFMYDGSGFVHITIFNKKPYKIDSITVNGKKRKPPEVLQNVWDGINEIIKEFNVKQRDKLADFYDQEC